MNKNNSVLIVGGGYTGIATAVFLIDKGYKVHVVELSNYLGGLGKVIKLSNKFHCEAFYHHFFIKDTYLIDFVKRFLKSKPTYKSTKMSIFHKKRHHNWNGLIDLILYPHITLISKIRFIFSIILLSKGYLKGMFLDKYSLSFGMKKLFGRSAFKSIWSPILNGKFGNKVNSIPLRWMSGRLKQRLESRKLGIEKLGYLKGSLNKLTDKIVEFINNSSGSKIYSNSQISNIKLNKKESQYLIEIINNKNQVTKLNGIDKIIFTIDQNTTSEILKNNALLYKDKLQKHNYFTSYCVLLELRESLSNAYWTNIADKAIYFCGYIEQTNLTGTKEYGGIYLGYLTKYLFLEKNEKVLSNIELEELAFKSLIKLFPNKDIKAIVKKIHISISHKAQVVTDFDFCATEMDYFKKKNIYLGNMSNVYPDERSINNAIKVGFRLSKYFN